MNFLPACGGPWLDPHPPPLCARACDRIGASIVVVITITLLDQFFKLVHMIYKLLLLPVFQASSYDIQTNSAPTKTSNLYTVHLKNHNCAPPVTRAPHKVVFTKPNMAPTDRPGLIWLTVIGAIYNINPVPPCFKGPIFIPEKGKKIKSSSCPLWRLVVSQATIRGLLAHDSQDPLNKRIRH